MSEYQVLARKFRPQTFHDVVGQEAIVATLKNALVFKRTAHAYLFCGGRGTGKTTLARLFAKALNCSARAEDAEPCNSCSSCREIASSSAMDVLEIDGASHRGIEDVRQINETIGFAPLGGHCKIYLIDEVHMLTKEAFNALLKTLEEPPPHVKFFFCTTEPHKIPATILSRCQRFNLRRIGSDVMAAKLESILKSLNLSYDLPALQMIAERSEGSLRDALSILDQLLAFGKDLVNLQTLGALLGLPSHELLLTLATAGANNDLMAAFKIAEEVFVSGKSFSYFLEELTAHFRTLLLLKNGVKVQESGSASYVKAAGCYRQDQLIQILELLIEAQQNLKSAPSERTFLEMVLLQILRTHSQVTLESLVSRLIGLEQSLAAAPEARLPPSSETPPTIAMPAPAASLPPSPPAPAKKSAAPVKPAVQEVAVASPAKTTQAPSTVEQSRFDTIMRFAAKELNGSLKKE